MPHADATEPDRPFEPPDHRCASQTGREAEHIDPMTPQLTILALVTLATAGWAGWQWLARE